MLRGGGDHAPEGTLMLPRRLPGGRWHEELGETDAEGGGNDLQIFHFHPGSLMVPTAPAGSFPANSFLLGSKLAHRGQWHEELGETEPAAAATPPFDKN